MKIQTDILTTYKTIDETYIDILLQEEINKSKKKIVVLDDDPTGVQTVHDVSVYTNWSKSNIRAGFQEENPLFYILTNSRGFTANHTTNVHQEIAKTIDEVSKEMNQDYIVISRSDSTLRGHYPLETEVLKNVIETCTDVHVDGEILCPFFKEGGRFTLNNVHYVKYGEELIPAGDTEFARDKTFGYQSSNMGEYIEEKTRGEYKAEDVICISLEQIREIDIDGITEQLMQVKNFNKIVINAIDYVDIKVVCIAIYRAMSKGKTFIFRTAAALVKVIGGITDQPLLTRNQMIVNETSNGGIIIVGSHTEKTTSQVEALRELKELEFIEFNSDLVLDEAAFEQEVQKVIAQEEVLIAQGKTVVVYTKRKLLTVKNDTKEEALLRSVRISDAVQSLVGKLRVTPSFVIAKGGITSSDIGTKALAVQKAKVLGQIKPGIPVWQTGQESKYPNTPYVIFPGNVGENSTLKEAVDILLQEV